MLLKKPTKDQMIALSGVFQACQLVETLAKTGSIPTDRFQVCIESLFQQNPDSTEQVFGSVDNLQLGMETLQELLTLQTTAKQSDTLRYAVGVIHLSRKLLNHDQHDRRAAGTGRSPGNPLLFSQSYQRHCEPGPDLSGQHQYIPLSHSGKWLCGIPAAGLYCSTNTLPAFCRHQGSHSVASTGWQTLSLDFQPQAASLSTPRPAHLAL